MDAATGVFPKKEDRLLEDFWRTLTDPMNATFHDWSVKWLKGDPLDGTLEKRLPLSISQNPYKISLPGRVVCRLFDGALALHILIAGALKMSTDRDEIADSCYVLPAYLVIELFAAGMDTIANALLFRYGAEGAWGLVFLMVVLGKAGGVI